MIELKRIKDTESSEFEAVERLYIEAFPPDERRETEIMKEKIMCGEMALDGIILDETQVGFITTWDLGEVIYVEHFAMEPWARGRGIGANTLEILKKRNEKPLLLEVEPPETGEVAVRRIGFYNRCGFDTICTEYVQPPYGPGKNALPLHLMATGNADVDAVIQNLHYRVYKKSGCEG